jgi:hypothetical protein
LNYLHQMTLIGLHHSRKDGVNINKKLHDKYSLTFDDLHQKALQESQVHNKCLFCSKMSAIYVQIPFVSSFGIHIQTLTLVSVISDKNFKKWYYRSKKHFKLSTESIIRMFLTYSFNKVPTGVLLLVFVSNGTQVTMKRKWHDQKMADCQTPDWFCYHSLSQHHRTLIIISIDGWHLVEPLGSATSFISQWDFIGNSGEAQISDFLFWFQLRILPANMSSVILTDIIQTVLETLVFPIKCIY